MSMTKRSFFKLSVSGVVAGIMAAALPMSSAVAAEDFYRGKTIRVVSSTGAGGTMDLYLLLTMKHMEKHLPPRTRLVLEHRTGGGGTVMANYFYTAAPKDGTYIGMPVPSLVSATFSAPDQARYNPAEFGAVGRLTDLPRVFVARTDSGIKTMEDAVNASGDITHGVMTVGASLDQFMTAANEAIGTKFRKVPGYSGGGPTFLAMEQGEVQSTTAEPGNLLSNKWHLVEDGTISVLAVGGGTVAGLEHVPSWLDFVPEDHPKRDVVEAVSLTADLGLSLITPPGVPADRLAYLRELLAKTMNDPEFIAEAKERNIPVNFASGEQLEQIIANASEATPEVRKWFADLLGN